MTGSRRLRVDMRKVSVIPHGAPAVRSSAQLAARRAPAADRSDLGSARARQGHRVGYRGDGGAARPRSRAALHRRRPDASQGAAARGRGVPQPARTTARRARASPTASTRQPIPRQPWRWVNWSTPPTSCCCPTTRPIRSRPACSSRRSPRCKPVIATRFPHAVELLGDGAGLLVPQKDPAAMADALRTLLTRPDVAAGMTRDGGRRPRRTCNGRRSPSSYLDLAGRLISAPGRCVSAAADAGPAVFDHLHRAHRRVAACSSTHCTVTRAPNTATAWTTSLAALVVICREPEPGPSCARLRRHYLDFTLSAVATRRSVPQPDERRRRVERRAGAR